jgi:hypothetical protein
MIEDTYGVSPLQHGVLYHTLDDRHAELYIEQFIFDFPDEDLTDRERGFRLAKQPLTRLAVFRKNKTHYHCVWTFDHLLLDRRSSLSEASE